MTNTTSSQKPWNVLSPYYEVDIGESIHYTTREGSPKLITVDAVDEHSTTVRVNEVSVRIPLSHFARTTTPQAPGDVVNVVEIEGVKIGADANKTFMKGSKYSLSLINLQKDARLFIGQAGEPLSPPGIHRFPVADYEWNFADNWLNKVPYGWHLGIDPNAELGHPLVAVTHGTVIAIRNYDPAPDEPEDYWGNNLGLLGEDGVLYCYMHWDQLSEGITVGKRLKAGDPIGTVGRSGFETKPFPTHLHFEMMILKHPEKFYFAYELDPEVLPTPNRLLQPEVEGHVINPYPYLVEWYLH
jgi:murein DD-endopeptidase MepM/ murein hydrolase activator NlpD